MPGRVTLTWCQGWKRPWQRLRRRDLPLPAANFRSAQTWVLERSVRRPSLLQCRQGEDASHRP